MFFMMMCDATMDEIREAGMDWWKAAHNSCPFPCDSAGYNWTATYVSTTGDPIADITSDMAAEERARAGYEGAIAQCCDPDVIAPLQFLREREIVHYQRFGEALNLLNDKLKGKRCTR